MGFKKLKENRTFKFFTNTYVVILTVFIIWMVFFDENSFLNHRKFNKEIDELKTTIEFYQSEIKKDKETIKKLQDTIQLERFAREKYLMKRKNEDIYIIKTDTTKN